MTAQGKTDAELAEIGYHAYRETTGGRSAVSGAPLPETLADGGNPQVSAGWEAAAHAIATALHEDPP